MKPARIPRPYIRSEPTHAREVADTHPPVSDEVLQMIRKNMQRLGAEADDLALITCKYPIRQQEFTYQGHRYISLTKLAADVGISLSHLSRILSRQRLPSLAVAVRLASAMGITLDTLAQRLGLLPTAQ